MKAVGKYETSCVTNSSGFKEDLNGRYSRQLLQPPSGFTQFTGLQVGWNSASNELIQRQARIRTLCAHYAKAPTQPALDIDLLFPDRNLVLNSRLMPCTRHRLLHDLSRCYRRFSSCIESPLAIRLQDIKHGDWRFNKLTCRKPTPSVFQGALTLFRSGKRGFPVSEPLPSI